MRMRSRVDADPLLRVEELTTEFPGLRAVDGVSFSVARGSIVALVGSSGSGKTVTALSLLRLVREPGRIVAGRVLYGGRDLLLLAEPELRAVRGGRIATVFQDPLTALHPAMRIGDQIAEAIRAHLPLGAKEAATRAVGLLELTGTPLSGERARAFPHQLSSGLRQRATIAMALAADPELLIADEPTTSLDATLQRELLGLFARLRRERGLAMLLITHDLAIAAALADQVLVMDHGQIVERGSPRELLGSPRYPATARLVTSAQALETPAPAPHSGPSRLLELDHVSKRFEGTRQHAVEDVSLHIHAGETLALVGESGSGKTTLGRIAVRLLAPSSGCVRFAGSDLASLDSLALRRVRRELQIIFPDPAAALDPRQRVGAIVGEPLQVHRMVSSERQRTARVVELLEQVGLEALHARRYPHQLSGGQRQRVAIARALATKPRLIVADEPLTALDVTTQAEIIELLARLQATTGLSLLLIAHDLRIVRRLATRVAVMRAGQIVELATAGELYRSPQHPYTRSLLSAAPALEGLGEYPQNAAP